eukprot:m.457180 g.457180  ORF g.457180 m.457180 type:complete len:100 (-) comp56981_c2_seq13:2129-2428(-)
MIFEATLADENFATASKWAEEHFAGSVRLWTCSMQRSALVSWETARRNILKTTMRHQESSAKKNHMSSSCALAIRACAFVAYLNIGSRNHSRRTLLGWW